MWHFDSDISCMGSLLYIFFCRRSVYWIDKLPFTAGPDGITRFGKSGHRLVFKVAVSVMQL